MVLDPRRRMPGPGPLRVARNLLAGNSDPLVNMAELHAAWGDVVAFRAGPDRMVLLAHPDDIEVLLVGAKDKVVKDRFTRMLSATMGDGLLTAEGETWKRHRRLLAPSFGPKAVAAWAEIMVGSTRAHLPAPGEHEIHGVLGRIALDIVARTLFGAEPPPEVAKVGPALEGLMGAFELENRSVWRFLPAWVPAAHRTASRGWSDTLREVLRAVIARRRALPAGPDLLWRLMEARGDDGSALTDAELMDEAVTVFLAGHETTAIALTFALWLLAGHPDVQERVRVEVGALGRDPGAADLARLPITAAVVKEALRLYPPAWALARETVAPLEVRGFVIPPGSQVVASPWVVHRDPRWWAEPLAFRPERFLAPNAPAHRFAWFPFGGGPRVCIGSHFALLEAVLALAVLVRERRFERARPEVPRLLPAVTLRPRDGVPLRVRAA